MGWVGLPGSQKGCCGYDLGELPSLRSNFNLDICTNVSAFEAAAKHVDDPACTTNCTADCPEVDVSDLFGIAATRMIGCCLPDGTCGGTAQSLPMFAQTAFGTPQCFSLPSISAAFAALNTPWQVQLPPPTKCQP